MQVLISCLHIRVKNLFLVHSCGWWERKGNEWKRYRTSHGQFCLTSVNWNNSSHLCNCRMVQKIRKHIKYSITSRVPTVDEKSLAHCWHMLASRFARTHTQTQMCACINQWWPMCVFVDWTVLYMFFFHQHVSETNLAILVWALFMGYESVWMVWWKRLRRRDPW